MSLDPHPTPRRPSRRLAFAACALLAAVISSGCAQEEEDAPSATSLEDLKPALDEVIDFTEKRHLDTSVNAGWQIMHAMLAYGREAMVHHKGELVPALDVAMAGEMRGWNMRPAPKGVENWIEAGSAVGPGHEDQWLAVLAQCGLDWDDEFYLNEKREKAYTMGDIVRHAQWTVREDKEMSWTIIGFAQYLPHDPEAPNQRGKLADAKWTAQDGTEWTVERVIASEARQALATSACGGSHRLIGMTMALERYLLEGGELTGGWKAAHDVILDSIDKARLFQQPDGTFSVNYFSRASGSPDLALQINTTGHTLEFLSLAIPVVKSREELKAPWVARAAARLCDLFKKTRRIDLECGSLYHAAHGLILYRDHVFGPAEPATAPAEGYDPAAPPGDAVGPPGEPVTSDTPPPVPGG